LQFGLEVGQTWLSEKCDVDGRQIFGSCPSSILNQVLRIFQPTIFTILPVAASFLESLFVNDARRARNAVRRTSSPSMVGRDGLEVRRTVAAVPR
jgi:hypothetical protein